VSTPENLEGFEKITGLTTAQKLIFFEKVIIGSIQLASARLARRDGRGQR
jgi:hypothetical protein